MKIVHVLVAIAVFVAASSVVRPDVSITPRLGTTKLLFAAAHRLDLRPSWVVQDGLFAIVVNGREEYVHSARSPLNSAVGSSLAKNKYLTRLALDRNGMRNIPFARPRTHDQALAFLDVHGKIIAKPLCGSGAHDIHIITSAEQLCKLSIKEYILEKYIVGKEMRYLVLNDAVIAVHESEYGVSVEEDRALQRISYPESSWDAVLVSDSLRIAKILGLRFAAVDYLIDDAGMQYVLEVNTMPGLKWFHAPTTGPVVDVAHLFLMASYLQESNVELVPTKGE